MYMYVLRVCEWRERAFCYTGNMFNALVRERTNMMVFFTPFQGQNVLLAMNEKKFHIFFSLPLFGPPRPCKAESGRDSRASRR